ncbi:MAG: hypothetical protein GTO24_12670, partial [candidate division Zixibacteria bacterium]|nr:hypothetical protein [candidate division Zixibacteria bacterium]
KLRKEKVSDEELTKAKNSVKAFMFYRLNRPFSVASMIGHFHLLAGDYNLLFKAEDRFDSITPEIIQQVAERTFAPTNRTVLSLVPKA